MKNAPKYKICRRLGSGVFDKCQTTKFATSSSKAPRQKRPKTLSDYAQQFLDKQRVRFSYGVSEKQFANYVKKVQGSENAPGKLFELLEHRLDNVVYRLGLANSRAFARQMVAHGHFTINGKKITIPSFHVRPGDVIVVREGSKQKALFQDLDKKMKNYKVPDWLLFDPSALSGNIKSSPKNTEGFLNFSTVLEFYSR